LNCIDSKYHLDENTDAPANQGVVSIALLVEIEADFVAEQILVRDQV